MLNRYCTRKIRFVVPAMLCVAALGITGIVRAAEHAEGKPLIIGVVGYEGHGSVFADELNAGLGDTIGLKVGYVWHNAPMDAAKVERLGFKVVETPEEMIGKIDGVLITEELPHRYRELAEPFIRAGVRTFLNRPLAASAEDAAAILRLARECNNPVFSASALSVSPAVISLREERKQFEPLKVVNVTGPSNHFWWYVPHAISALVSALGPGVEEVFAHDFAWDTEELTIKNPLVVYFRYGAASAVGPVRGTVQIVPQTQDKDWYGFRLKLYGHNESPEYDLFKAPPGESPWMPMYQSLIAFFRDGTRPLTDAQLLEVPLILDMVRKSGIEHRAVARSEYASFIEGIE